MLPIAPAVLLLLFLLGTSFFWIQPAIESLMLKHSKERIKQLVEVAWSIADELGSEVANGELTEEEARRRFVTLTKILRYGEGMDRYFWVHNTDGELVIHPFESADTWEIHLKESYALIMEDTQSLINGNGETYTRYMWHPKDNMEDRKIKISFMKYYEPWNWVIGTGFFEKDTLEEIRFLNKSFLGSLGVWIILMLLSVIIFIRGGFKTSSLLLSKDKLVESSRARYENMAKNVSHGIAIFENDALVFFNTRLTKLLDLETKDFTEDTVIVEQVKDFLRFIKKAEIVERASNARVEARGAWYKTCKGRNSFLVLRQTEDPNNNTIYYTISDWTLRKHQTHEIKRLSQVVEDCPLSVVITDKEGTILYANPYSEVTSGYSLEEIIGDNPRQLKSNRVPASVYQQLWETIVSGKTWQGELHNKAKDGKLYWEYAYISPMVDDEGNVESYYAIKRDITETKRLEQELIAARNKAEESNRIKSLFLNNVSHEIRTPLNAISGFFSIIEEEFKDNPTIHEYRDVIHENVQILLNVVDDILTVSQIESDKAFEEYEYWNVDDILNGVVEKICNNPSSGLSNDVELLTQFDENLSEKVVFTDRSKMETIFNELVENAIKYTKTGKISLGYTYKKSQLEFFVSDTGSGIPDKEKDFIFDLFYHGNTHFVSLHKGTGLGLNIVKKMVHMMGGSIRFESTPEKETTFYVSSICKVQ